MKVNFHGALQKIIGRKTVELGITPGETVETLFRLILEKYPQCETELSDGQGGLSPRMHFFVDGVDVPYLPVQMKTPLDPDAKISIFPVAD